MVHVCTLYRFVSHTRTYFLLCGNFIKFFPIITVSGDDDGSPMVPTTPAGPTATLSSTPDSDVPLAMAEEEGSSQEDDIMNVSTASSLGEELPATPTPHPQEVEEYDGAFYPSSDAKTGSSSKQDGKSNATRTDFLKAIFSKKNNLTKDDIAKKAPTVTSLIPARNSPRKIETREVRDFYIHLAHSQALVLHTE